MTQSGELTLELKRVVPAAPSVVLRGVQRCGRACEVVGAEGLHRSEPRPSSPASESSYRIEMQPADGDPFYITGEFREVDPPARLVYTFVYEDPDPDDVETLAELSFRDLGESTEVVLTQGPFTDRGAPRASPERLDGLVRQARATHLSSLKGGQRGRRWSFSLRVNAGVLGRWGRRHQAGLSLRARTPPRPVSTSWSLICLLCGFRCRGT